MGAVWAWGKISVRPVVEEKGTRKDTRGVASSEEPRRAGGSLRASRVRIADQAQRSKQTRSSRERQRRGSKDRDAQGQWLQSRDRVLALPPSRLTFNSSATS